MSTRYNAVRRLKRKERIRARNINALEADVRKEFGIGKVAAEQYVERLIAADSEFDSMLDFDDFDTRNIIEPIYMTARKRFKGW